MSSAKVPDELVVLLQGQVAGVLRRSGAASHVFTYDAAWRDDPEAFPLSLFARLANIGEDCTGAVQFAQPERVSDLAGGGPASIEWLSDHVVADLLRELTNENAMIGEACHSTMRLST